VAQQETDFVRGCYQSQLEDLRKQLNESKLEIDSLRQDYAIVIDDVQRQARQTFKQEQEQLEMKLKNEYVTEINRGRDQIYELQKLTQNVEQ